MLKQVCKEQMFSFANSFQKKNCSFSKSGTEWLKVDV